jgi:hypothetical protein
VAILLYQSARTELEFAVTKGERPELESTQNRQTFSLPNSSLSYLVTFIRIRLETLTLLWFRFRFRFRRPDATGRTRQRDHVAREETKLRMTAPKVATMKRTRTRKTTINYAIVDPCSCSRYSTRHPRFRYSMYLNQPE